MNFRTISALLSALGLAFSAGSTSAAEPGRPSVVFDVSAGPHDRRDTPVVLNVPTVLDKAGSLALEDLESKKSVPVQSLSGEKDNPAVVFILPELKAGASRRFRLSASDGAATPAAGCVCGDDGKRLTLKVDGRPVLTYQRATVESPPGLDPLYRRSGYIHPLLSPSGKEVTGDFSPDHAHQHAWFFAWVNTTFDGRKVDFWNQLGKTGRVRAVDVIETQSGPVFAGFSVRHRHEDLTAPNGPAPVLDEIWTVRAYRVDPAPGRFLIDFISRQACAAPTPLLLNKYIYGGFGMRGNTAWVDPKAKGNGPPDPSRSGESEFLTSDGKHRADGNHTRPRWVDLSGKIDGALAGVTVLDDPGNFRFPQPVRIHPNMPYFCFAPMVEEGFTIVPGKPYVSRYRVVPHDGPPAAKAVDALWNDLADPPGVKFVTE